MKVYLTVLLCVAALFFAFISPAHASIQADIKRMEAELEIALHPKTRDAAKSTKLIKEISKRELMLEKHYDSEFIVVNTEEQVLRLYKKGEIVLQEKVIVGKPETPTPSFTSTIQSITTNPVWDVPPDIAEDFIVRMRKTGQWAGYDILVNNESIKLSDLADEMKYRIVQEPSKRNALGTLKFNIPSHYGVYIHDTNKKELFEESSRQYSAGCVRMQHPDKLAAYLLNTTTNDVKLLVEKGQSTYAVNPITVYIE